MLNLKLKVTALWETKVRAWEEKPNEEWSPAVAIIIAFTAVHQGMSLEAGGDIALHLTEGVKHRCSFSLGTVDLGRRKWYPAVLSEAVSHACTGWKSLSDSKTTWIQLFTEECASLFYLLPCQVCYLDKCHSLPQLRVYLKEKTVLHYLNRRLCFSVIKAYRSSQQHSPEKEKWFHKTVRQLLAACFSESTISWIYVFWSPLSSSVSCLDYFKDSNKLVIEGKDRSAVLWSRIINSI